MGKNEARKQAVEAAFDAASKVIKESSNGTEEMVNELIMGVTLALLECTYRGYPTAIANLVDSGNKSSQIIVKAVGAVYKVIKDFPEKDPAVVQWLQYTIAERFFLKMDCFFRGRLSQHGEKLLAAEGKSATRKCGP